MLKIRQMNAFTKLLNFLFPDPVEKQVVEPDSVPEAPTVTVQGFTHIGNIPTELKQFLKKNDAQCEICSECSRLLEKLQERMITLYIADNLYLLSNNQFVCKSCAEKYIPRRRNEAGDEVCTDCGRKPESYESLTRTGDDCFVCRSCLGDRCID